MVFTTYITILYVISLQGLEGFLLDLKALKDMKPKATNEYIWLALRGKLKREKIEKLHSIPCANITSLGINVKAIVWRLVGEMEKLGRHEGPAVADVKGEMYSSVELDQMLQEVLEEVYDGDSSLFPPDIKQLEERPLIIVLGP